MLSILIPTYNYSALELVTEIHEQCEQAAIVYEIIVSDDGSDEKNSLEENRKINHLSHSIFKENQNNLGRAGNLNLLVEKAQYEWLLFMDCDVFPVKNNFISNYLTCINKSLKINFGGIAYKTEKPEKEKLLRWIYGKKREEITWEERSKNPFKTTLTSNILLHKSIFKAIQFNSEITEYGYEDLVFTEELKEKQFEINHINNSCYHLNYETSEIFMKKTETALKNLVELEKKGIVAKNITSLQSAYLQLNKHNLITPFFITYQIISPLLFLNLKSKRPILLFLDILKLGIYSKLKNYKE